MDPMMNVPPEVAAFLRRIDDRSARQAAQLKALRDRYLSLASSYEDDKLKLDQLQKALKKAQERIRYIEDIPGKRVPYFLGFQIELPAPSNPTTTIRGQRLSDAKPVSMDGPFVCTTYMSAFLLKTFSVGPYGTEGDQTTGRPNDPPIGTEVITPLTGRFRPVASTADPFAGAYIGARVGSTTAPTAFVDAQGVQTFRPGIVDFLWEISDVGIDRLRQNNVAMPSRYLYSEFDRPMYLAASDFFERGSQVQFTATFTRDVGFAEVNYAELPGGFAEGNGNPPPDPSSTSPDASVGRQVVALGGTLYFHMVGYKIVQAQSPAV